MYLCHSCMCAMSLSQLYPYCGISDSHTHTPVRVRFNGGDRGLCEWVYGKGRPLSVCPLAGLRETHTIRSLEHHSACTPLAVGLSEVFSIIK